MTRAVNVSVSPGQTCLANRTLNLRIASGPSQSFTTRAMSPAVSIPWPNTDGLPTCVAIVSSWCIGLKSPLAPGVADEVGAAQVLDHERRRLVADGEVGESGADECWWWGSHASPRVGRRSRRRRDYPRRQKGDMGVNSS